MHCGDTFPPLIAVRVRARRSSGAALARACARASGALCVHVPRAVRRSRARALHQLSCELLAKAATSLASHHIALHARVAHPVARDFRARNPDARPSRPCRARPHARAACASLPHLGAATPLRSPPCLERSRGCRPRGSRSREGPEHAVRAGGRAEVGASCTWEGRVRGVRARSPFLKSVRALQRAKPKGVKKDKRCRTSGGRWRRLRRLRSEVMAGNRRRATRAARGRRWCRGGRGDKSGRSRGLPRAARCAKRRRRGLRRRGARWRR